MSIEISRDRDFEQMVWEKLCEPYKGRERSKDLDHINVSDLTWCLRKGWYSKIYPDLDKKGPETYNN